MGYLVSVVAQLPQLARCVLFLTNTVSLPVCCASACVNPPPNTHTHTQEAREAAYVDMDQANEEKDKGNAGEGERGAGVSERERGVRAGTEAVD